MKLELIAPATREYLEKRGKALSPPLGLAMVAAVTPPGIEISITDENATPVDFNQQPDLVGITAMTITAQRAYQIADTFRKKGVKVIMGGSHPSALPDEAGQHADSVVIGEAEGIWPSVIEDFKANRLQKFYQSKERPSLADLPLPRRDLFAKNAYFCTNTISTSRGCPYACSFCSVTSFFGHTYRYRPVEDIVKEIETLPNKKFLGFVDDNLFGNPKFAKELLRALIPFKTKWIAEVSVNVAKDDEMLRLAAASGCMALLLGFETISPDNLGIIGKRVNVVDEYDAVVKKIHSYGIAAHGFFILGLDADDESIFARTVRFAQRVHLETAQFSLLVPYPGTELCKTFDAEGRVITKDWSQYEFDPVFEPKRMSRETLKKGYCWAWKELYSIPSIYKRVGLIRRNAPLFWFANLALRSSWKNRKY